MSVRRYSHLFFDLDHTLWDMEENARRTLDFLFQRHLLIQKGVPSAKMFYDKYLPINQYYWKKYEQGKVTKAQVRVGRFSDTLQKFGIQDAVLAEQLAHDYIYYGPRQTALIPGTLDVLNYLKPRYEMHIITNGFQEAQVVKLKESGLESFFTHVFISEELGFQKPDVRIFEQAMQISGSIPNQSLMIGDNLHTDITGARAAGMDQVYFQVRYKRGDKAEATYKIRKLTELKKLL